MRHWPARLALLAIGFYRAAISPLLHALGGPSCGCRFYPCCSQYGADAVRRFGASRGLLLASCRILRCAPWGRGGIDPVPDHWKEGVPALFRKRVSKSAPEAAHTASPHSGGACPYHHHG